MKVQCKEKQCDFLGEDSLKEYPGFSTARFWPILTSFSEMIQFLFIYFYALYLLVWRDTRGNLKKRIANCDFHMWMHKLRHNPNAIIRRHFKAQFNLSEYSK